MSAQEIASQPTDLADFVPASLRNLGGAQSDIPAIAHDQALTSEIESAIKVVPTQHNLFLGDARDLSFLAAGSIHLVLTSPPYWTLKEYRVTEGQLGYVSDYADFLRELDKVWKHCFRLLVPGGRLVCVVGDVLLSRRKNGGRHTVVPLHASIQEHCRDIGYDNLAPIIWHKIGNARYEAGNGSTFLGKPYEPNAVIKNDIEYVLMQRRPGGYRSPTQAARLLSVIPAERHHEWFQQIWTGIGGASTRDHPAPFPLKLAERLVRMFSFVGDTVLDPFAGTGTTNVAALSWGRNSIGVEIDSEYLGQMENRIRQQAGDMFRDATVDVANAEDWTPWKT